MWRQLVKVSHWPAVLYSYSALIPSSTLTALDMSECPPPAGAMQHAFTPGCMLPQLQHIMMGASIDKPLYDWNQAEVFNLVTCCPNLHNLQCGLLPCVSLACCTLACCTQLSGLTQLHAFQYGTMEEHTARVQEVAELTNLQRLVLCLEVCDSRLAPAVLQPLTALKQLVCLHCWQVLPDSKDSLAYIEMSSSSSTGSATHVDYNPAYHGELVVVVRPHGLQQL